MIIFLALSLFFAFLILFWQISLIVAIVFGAPVVNAKNDTIVEAFKLAKLKKDETILDLGCSNARSLIIAAKRFGAKGIGVEISPFYYLKAKINVILSGQSKRIKIIYGDLKKKGDLIKRSDVLYLYLFPKLLCKIEQEIFRQLKNDARVVTVGFRFKNHKIKSQVEVENHSRKTKIYLY